MSNVRLWGNALKLCREKIAHWLARDHTMPGQLLKLIRSLGVLTGGGDVPGLNAAIKALVYSAEPMGIRVVGLHTGWKGISHLDRSRSIESLLFDDDEPGTWQDNYLIPLNRLSTRNIDSQA